METHSNTKKELFRHSTLVSYYVLAYHTYTHSHLIQKLYITSKHVRITLAQRPKTHPPSKLKTETCIWPTPSPNHSLTSSCVVPHSRYLSSLVYLVQGIPNTLVVPILPFNIPLNLFKVLYMHHIDHFMQLSMLNQARLIVNASNYLGKHKLHTLHKPRSIYHPKTIWPPDI